MSTLLQMSEVSKRFRRGGRELCVLHEASFELHAGEVLSVLGMRGQGKTTLLRIAAGMESADVGAVRLQGRDLGALSDGELSDLLGTQIAWAGKSGPGMPVRMLDYVAMPLLVGRAKDKRAAYKRAQAALERVGACGCEQADWESISDWERALVEVAQAIAGGPALLLVDDVTDTLGIRETDELTALLRELSRETRLGVLMSVSDAQATLWSDRIMTLSGGRLIQSPQGPSGNVIEFPDLGVQRREAGRGSSS
jgi:putative ABC transport system ATP-binding protein